jgi:putative chitinase
MTTSRFFEVIRPLWGGTMDQVEVDNVNLLIGACRRARTNRQSAAYILATAFHETGGLRDDVPPEENLNYSAEGLMATWPTRFTAAGTAAAYERQPERIANRVYASRMGNGDEASGDGWRFRGRGFVQLTGRENYRRLGELVGAVLETRPELAREPEIAARILVVGMQRGLFTGVSLDDVSEPATSEPDFENDRAVVNGGDRAKKIAGYAKVFHEALADVDLLADSRTVRAAKATRRSADLGTILSTGAAAAAGASQVLTDNTDELIAVAQKGLTLSQLLGWGGACAAAVLVVLFVINRVMANQAEAARREDNEVMGV